jgi:molecular chaperone GrpE (heat shock protein)
MSDKKRDRAERQAREVEESERALRESISQTERLVGESENMLRRHGQEREDADE